MHCNGCLSNQSPAVEPGQCIATGVCPTKALRWRFGNTLHWVFVLPRPWGRAKVVHCIGCLAYQEPAVGARQCVAVVPWPYDGDQIIHCTTCVSYQGLGGGALGVCYGGCVSHQGLSGGGIADWAGWLSIRHQCWH